MWWETPLLTATGHKAYPHADQQRKHDNAPSHWKSLPKEYPMGVSKLREVEVHERSTTIPAIIDEQRTQHLAA